MNEEKFKEQQKEKKKRKKSILSAVEKFPIKTQKELVEILSSEYGIDTYQATVSRDIRELKIGKDDETRTYILGPQASRNKEAKQLATLFLKSEVIQFDTETESILLKLNPHYASLVASQLEAFLHADGIPVWTFIGHNGALLLCFPKKKKVRIESHLSKILDYVSKNRKN